MALAISNLTGHPVRCIDYGSCVHAFVQTPEGDVIDIHGRHTWASFLSFLVDEGCLPRHALAPGTVQPFPLPEPSAISIAWRHAGYKHPSAKQVAAAARVATSHPNLGGILRSRKP